MGFKKRLKKKLNWLKGQLLIRNLNFTIISSNCIGSGVYQDLSLKYNTPTAGLFFYAPCYIKFIHNLQYYCNQNLSFKKDSRYVTGPVSYPIGMLDDIEVHFLHYADENEATEKWNRRVKRINYSNLFYIFTDRDQCTYKELSEFDSFDSQAKLCFSSKNYPELKSLIFIKEDEGEECVGDLHSSRLYRNYVDIIKWLNLPRKKG